MSETIKTVLLLSLLTGLFLGVGYYLGGSSGAGVALIFSLLMNFFAYWYSDKIVLRMYNAKEISKAENSAIHQTVEEISEKAGIPKPKIYLVDQKAPNAFATGRNPKNGALAVTTGLLDILDDAEVKGVLSHEIAHIKNRDTLISTLAATFAGALAFIAQTAYNGALFGGRDRNRNPIGLVLMVVFVPLAATIVRLAISRSREFAADRTGAMTIEETKGLASALVKISDASRRVHLKGNTATSHMFIVNPFSGDFLISLLSTHPSTEARIKSLKSLKI
ncbi:MAG: zinc metalloprotease HtpX [Candidatus Aenigmarchaeota archaeon]|nr:zinc metalloprotease HtpX [Candidatus Aenigmarchaeota archaeon]